MNVPQANPVISSVRSLKDTAKGNIRDVHEFPKAISALALVAISDKTKRDFLLEGLSAINVAAIALTSEEIPTFRNISCSEKIHPNELLAFDFFLFDGEDEDLDVVKCMKAGVVPIMPEKNVFAGILREFNPMKFEGNSFLFGSDAPFAMFAKTVAYLENVKFPEDRRVLLKNVLGTF